MRPTYWEYGFDGWKKIESLCNEKETIEDFMKRVGFNGERSLADDRMKYAADLGWGAIWPNRGGGGAFAYYVNVYGPDCLDDYYMSVFVGSLPELCRMINEVSGLMDLMLKADTRIAKEVEEEYGR
jgi:hypothetical protein